MGNIYTDGQYLEATQTWHAEDSPWKARQIEKIIYKNKLQPNSIAEIGCGSGSILDELSKQPKWQHVSFEGYDISPQAIEIANKLGNKRIGFFQDDILSEDNEKYFDVLMAIDVFEHVPDYMGFVSKCKEKAKYKIYHIPLDIHVSSVIRNSFTNNRYTIGHIHYFTADTAISTLLDTGHEVMDYFYTNGAMDLFKEHPEIKTAVANVPRWLFSKFSVPFTARLFGGYSLLVLAK
jgi:SAM-dependent methyltransferase